MELALAIGAGTVALLGAFIFHWLIQEKPTGNEKMTHISKEIAKGATTFMIREGKVLSVFVLIVAVLLFFALDKAETPSHEGFYTAIAFIIGAIASFLAGYFGMKTATSANVRTAEAARHDLSEALRISFNSGSAMGLSVVGLGLLGLSALYWIFTHSLGLDTAVTLNVLTGFGLGGSSIALFARVGGGIYTKAADVGADLVGKVEKDIPEDDPRNPAVIADNVGDNVGDVAGMGADLFESYVGSLIAAFIIGYTTYQMNGIYLPLMIAAAGVVASIIGMFFVRTHHESQILSALKRGLFVASILVIVASWFLCSYFMGDQATNVFIALVSGIVVGVIVGLLTEYYTASQYKPVQKLANTSKTGAATVIIEGIALGYRSTALTILFISIAIY